jgi:hypothetical protein
MNFVELREKYPNFIYSSYSIQDEGDKIVIGFEFEIENLAKFTPHIEILKKNFNFKPINDKVRNIVFNMGMIEAMSYFKATCSPQFLIKCGSLDDFQKEWFKKLFYIGLGEFRYRNNINIDQDSFVNFDNYGEAIKVESEEDLLSGILIPIGGGKDSNVTMEILKKYNEESLAFRIGKNEVADECARLGGFNDDRVVEIKRTIDKDLLELNKRGFLNGHTPFSAVVAFNTYLCAYLLGKKNVALSNENSANESNVVGENINHQYSKTIEFENDFRDYADRYLKGNVNYFSLLRPLSELQIAKLFSRYEKYHKVFKSCNVGSKSSPWIWCCNCPKCLFVYSILSPFLYKDKLVEIFGQDMFENTLLLSTFIELCGYGEIKPFECVGTYSEVRYAVSETIRKYEDKPNLPYLLKYYYEHFELSDENPLNDYNEDHNVPKEFEDLLKQELYK